MRALRGFLGGVFGALSMSAGMGLLRLLGVPIDWEMMLGSLLLGATGPLVWLIGLGMHLLIGGGFGVAYAAIFEHGLKEVGAGVGSAVGAAHAAITGVFLAFVPQLHPLVPEVWPAPGVFLLGLGAFGVLLFIALHVMFGAIVGGYYAATPVLRQIVLRHRQRVFTRS